MVANKKIGKTRSLKLVAGDSPPCCEDGLDIVNVH